jgi:prevent-host-death family protein
MNRIPQMASISDLRNRHLEILARLEQGPVLLASRNRPAAVLVSPEQWNELVDLIADYEDILVTKERIHEAESSPEAMRPIDELWATLKEDGLLDD